MTGRLKIKCVLRKFLYEHQPTPVPEYPHDVSDGNTTSEMCVAWVLHHIDNGCCTKLSKQ